MIRTYVDSGVLIDAYRSSATLARSALALLGDPNREFVSCDVVNLEFLPKPTYYNRTAEVAFYQTFFAALSPRTNSACDLDSSSTITRE